MTTATLEPAYTLLHGPIACSQPTVHPLTGMLLADASAILDGPLNDEQQRAFREALTARLMLLWGPAGTGKTAVLSAAIRASVIIAREEGRPVRIGIGSTSYNALDNLLVAVTNALDAPGTLGSMLMSTPVYRLRSKSALPLADPRVTNIARGPGALPMVTSLEDALQTMIVAGTGHQLYQLADSVHTDNSPARWFDVLCLDEASQIPVSDAATYYCLLAEEGRVVMAGDHRQLGPINQYQPEDDRGGLFGSVFDYMQETHNIEPVQLVINYRTNKEIAGWPEARFYDGQYQAYFPDRRLALTTALASGDVPPDGWPDELPWSPEWARIIDPALPVVVLSYRAQRHTVSNVFEAQVVASLAALIRRHVPPCPPGSEDDQVAHFWSEQMAIITPHRAQMSMITNLLVGSGVFPRRPVPHVDTVDRFQGQERDIILASYSVSDPDFIAAEERFILDPRRFNVTLTRARAKFVVLVSESLLQHLPYDKAVAEEAAGLQLFAARHCSQSVMLQLPYIENDAVRFMPARMRCPTA
jgi:AAA domain